MQSPITKDIHWHPNNKCMERLDQNNMTKTKYIKLGRSGPRNSNLIAG